MLPMIPVSATFCRGHWGKVSGLYAGDLMFSGSCFQYTRSQPLLTKVYWKLDPRSFAISQQRVAKVKTGGSVERIM